jgi:hypothetical protein
MAAIRQPLGDDAGRVADPPLAGVCQAAPPGPKPINVNILIAGMSDLMRSTSGELIQIEPSRSRGLVTKADPFKNSDPRKYPTQRSGRILHGASN